MIVIRQKYGAGSTSDCTSTRLTPRLHIIAALELFLCNLSGISAGTRCCDTYAQLYV